MAALPGPGEVLSFWFEEAGPSKWWKRDDAFDRLIVERFSALHARAAAGGLEDWRETPDGLLALILVLDQFSRNIHRDSANAYAQDGKALSLAIEAVDKGFDLAVDDQERRHFFYLPFMHCEDPAHQDRCVALVEERICDPRVLEEAKRHRDVVRRFGRFPHRNAALGRSSTDDEAAYLDAGGGWG